MLGDETTAASSINIKQLGKVLSKMMNKQIALKSSLELEHSWTQKDIEDAVNKRDLRIEYGIDVEAGKKWKVFQYIGRVGYWKIRTLKMKTYDCNCNGICLLNKSSLTSKIAISNSKSSNSVHQHLSKVSSIL